MPSKSKKQANLMKAAAHDKAFAKKVGIDQATAREYVEADKKRTSRKKAKSSNEAYAPVWVAWATS